MTKTMIELVSESKPSDKWIKIYGKNQFLEDDKGEFKS